MSTYSPTRAVSIFLLAMSVLILEVSLTRIFSFITFYHFTYLVISVAMLGFGAAGTYLTTQKNVLAHSSMDEFLADNSCLMGLTMIAAVVLIPRIHFYPMDIQLYKDYSNVLSFLVIVLLAGVPFFFAGVCIGYIISVAGNTINRIYFADLVGAATGCLLAIVLINTIGGIAACFATATIAMLVAVIVGTRLRRRYLMGFLTIGILTLIIARTQLLPLYAPPDKMLFRAEYLVELIKWHVITRLDVTQPVEGYTSFGGGLSFEYKGEPQKIRLIYQDGSNLTGILQPTPTPRETPSLGYYLQGAPYQVIPQADTLVIGCGGGVDIMIALYHDARHVVGVDVNPHMIKLIQEQYSTFAKNVFNRKDVELITSEGRHFLSRDQRRFDVIQLTGVDTWSALSTGANALTEAFIYTSEGFDQYLSHLKENGIVNISRPYLTPPLETLKLAATAMEALERAGIEHPSQHLVILAGMGQTALFPWAQLLIKRSPFTREEINTLTHWTESLRFEVIYDPYTHREGELETLIHATPEERMQYIAHHPFNISPATDDVPFYFQQYRWRDLFIKRSGVNRPLPLFILMGTLVQVTILSALLILYPLYRRKIDPAKTGSRTGIFIYFASLGLGFIMIEITLLQKFMVLLGGPAYSMSITLFTILLTSGIGSFLSRNLSERPFRLLAMVVPLLVTLIVTESLLLDRIIASLMSLSHVLRGVAVVLLIAPVGLLMGVPFPAGLRHVDNIRPELNPWSWGINACATVIGSVICILISSLLGFRMTLIISAGIYLAGWLAFSLSQRYAEIKVAP